jgi:uroporphyrinogen decarboxylase
MKSSMLGWKESILSSPRRLALPIMTQPGIALIGANVREAVSNPKVHYRAAKILAERFPAIAATIMMDLSVEAESFGSTIVFGDHEVPTVTRRLVDTVDSIERLRVPDITEGRLPMNISVASRLADTITDRPVFAGCIGPISLAGRLFDVAEMMMAMYMDAATIHLLLEKCMRLLLAYVSAFKKAGANGVIIAEPVAGTLSPELCAAFSSAYVAQIVEAVQDDSFIVILHNCGDTEPLLESMEATGAWGIHLGNKCNIVAAIKTIHPERLVLGNLDPVSIFKDGTPSAVYDAATVLLNATARHPNFVLSSGCDIPAGTSIENVEAFYSAVKDFNASS